MRNLVLFLFTAALLTSCGDSDSAESEPRETSPRSEVSVALNPPNTTLLTATTAPEPTGTSASPTTEASPSAAGEPTLEDFAELVSFEYEELTDVVVTNVSPQSGDWILAEGTATLAEDHFVDLERSEVAELCGVTTDQLLALSTTYVYRPSLPAGTVGTFGYELVPSVAAERNDPDPNRITTNGWYAGSWAGGNVAGVAGFMAEGVSLNDLTTFGGNGGESVLDGSPELDTYCDQAAAQ
jgi:hypothetical protein